MVSLPYRPGQGSLRSIAEGFILRFMSLSVQNIADTAVVGRCRGQSTSYGGGSRVGTLTSGCGETLTSGCGENRLLAEDSFDPLEFALRCQDGTCKWFLWHRRFDSEHQAIFIAGYDITEQKSGEIASLLRSYEGPKRADAAI